METIVRYFEGAGVGEAGVGVGASILSTRPAGVRSVSIGVVSGVGGAAAGVELPAAGWWPSFAWDPQPAAQRAATRRATRARFRITLTSGSRRILQTNDKYCRWIDFPLPVVDGSGAASLEIPSEIEGFRGAAMLVRGLKWIGGKKGVGMGVPALTEKGESAGSPFVFGGLGL